MGKVEKEIQIDINKALSLCLKNGVKVYPVIVGGKFAIEVDGWKGKKIRYDSLLDGKKIAMAQSKTYKYYAKLILKEKQDA